MSRGDRGRVAAAWRWVAVGAVAIAAGIGLALYADSLGGHGLRLADAAVFYGAVIAVAGVAITVRAVFRLLRRA